MECVIADAINACVMHPHGFRCQCSEPVNASASLVETWNQTGYTPDTIPWDKLNVSVRPKTPNVTPNSPVCVLLTLLTISIML